MQYTKPAKLETGQSTNPNWALFLFMLRADLEAVQNMKVVASQVLVILAKFQIKQRCVG